MNIDAQPHDHEMSDHTEAAEPRNPSEVNSLASARRTTA
jgi:hypothetical protein